MTVSLPPPSWPLTTENIVTQPWYGYYKDIDVQVRLNTTAVAHFSTIQGPTTTFTVPSTTGAQILDPSSTSLIFLGASTITHILLAPAYEGQRVIIHKQTTAGGTRITTTSTAVGIRGEAATAGWFINMNAGFLNRTIELCGRSTLAWLVLSVYPNTAAITITTV